MITTVMIVSTQVRSAPREKAAPELCTSLRESQSPTSGRGAVSPSAERAQSLVTWSAATAKTHTKAAQSHWMRVRCAREESAIVSYHK